MSKTLPCGRSKGALLRARRFEELDLDNLIEEVEALARKDRREVESRAELILIHLLKLAYSPAPEPRREARLMMKPQAGARNVYGFERLER